MVAELKAYDAPEHFRDFAMMPKFTDDISALGEMAEPEDWEYKTAPAQHPNPILRNYITYTYRRVTEEKKISITADEEYCCWNTGLITAVQVRIPAKLNIDSG